MVNSCCVINCHSRNHARGERRQSNIRFFSFPAWKKHFGSKVSELTKRRRMAWVAAVRRKSITFNNIPRHMFVCSLHFHKGKPAYEMMDTDPDWAPSLNLGHNEVKCADPARSERRKKREQLKISTLHAADSMTHPAQESGRFHTEEEDGGDGLQPTKEETHNSSLEDAEAQTKCSLCACNAPDINSLLDENRQSGCELCLMSEFFFGGENDQVQYYTGLPNLVTFTALLHFLVPLMPDLTKILTPFQMLLLTFIRLRLDVPEQHLAHHFHVSPTTVYSIFKETVAFLYVNLKPSIVWPNRKLLSKMMPLQFVESFGHKVALIIDRFEISTGKPSVLNADCNSYIRYNHDTAIKYLIGITLNGSVCFISTGWSCYRNDKHVIQNSGLLDNLLQGDILLDGRGFEKRNRSELGTGVKFPAIPIDICPITAGDKEQTNEMVNHIPVVNPIINVCQQYKILTGAIPIDMALSCEGENVTFLDKIVTVCCVLTNQCQTAGCSVL